MKNINSGGQRGRERALLQASRRLNAALVRAARVGAPLEGLEAVTLLTGACGARGPLSGRVLVVCLVSLLMVALALVLTCGQLTPLSTCVNNSSKASYTHNQTFIINIHSFIIHSFNHSNTW